MLNTSWQTSLVAGWMAVLVAAGGGAPPTMEPDAIGSLVKKLVAPDPLERVSAAQALEHDDGISLRQIERLLIQREGLGPEQSRRLLAIARSRFIREPRAAVGVQFSLFEQDRNGVVVLERVEPEFPASGVLQAGDRIEAIDGVRLSAVSPMRPHILSRDPGDDISMTIVRQGVTMNVMVKLGRWSDLRNERRGGGFGGGRTIDPSERDMDEAWRQRSSRYPSPSPAGIIEAAVPPIPPTPPSIDDPSDAEALQAALDGPGALVVGGEAHGGDGREAPGVIAVGGEAQWRVARRVTDRDRLIDGLRRLQQLREESVRNLALINGMIPQTPPGLDRDRLHESARQVQDTIRSWDRQINQLQRRLMRQ
jgi:PDZ domain